MNITSGAGTSFIEMFLKTSISSIMCIVVGLMLIIIELFQGTHKKLAGVLGGISIIVGIAIRMLTGPSVGVLFFIVLSIAFVLLGTHLLMLVLQKRRWLIQSLSLALHDEEYLKTHTEDYKKLIDLTGIATTDIDETGHMSIGDVNFFVTAAEFIKKGSTVRVLEADRQHILVESLGDGFYIPTQPSITQPDYEPADDDENSENFENEFEELGLNSNSGDEPPSD